MSSCGSKITCPSSFTFGATCTPLPVHGMQTYRTRVHPANRIPEELRSSIFSCLDMALRADPSAADGVVTYKLYDPEVNTYGKMRNMIHRMLTLQLGEENVGSLRSSSFERLLGEYLDERDGRLSFARHDHNICTHCRELEIAAHTLELELKLMSPTTSQETRSVREKQCENAKEELEIHISLDRRIREHLGRIVDAFKNSENQYRADVLSSGNTRVATCPKWNSLPPGNGLLTHADDMSAINIPHFVLNSVSELTRFAYSVNAHVSPITGNATVFSVEQGEGPHDSSSVFEKVLLDHFLTCRGERIKVVWSDCASVGRSYASCVAVPQFLVDSGFCDLCLIGFMANCHGKWHCDSLFGMLRRKAINTNFISIDDLLDMFESIRRSGGGNVSAFALNPVSSTNWVEVMTRAGYDTTPHPDFGFIRFNPHYACAATPDPRSWLPPELLELLEPYLPSEANCVRLCPWPIEDPTKFLPFEHRPVDVPAARLKPRERAKVFEEDRSEENWACVISPSQPFQEGGDRVVSKRTAHIVGHNSSAFEKYAVELRSRNNLVAKAWPEDMVRPYVPNGPSVKCAPQNWCARRTTSHFRDEQGSPIPRYPPVNLLNALDGHGPRFDNIRHKHTATYSEDSFPVIQGTCAAQAVQRFASDHSESLEAAVSFLDIYKAVRSDMIDLSEERLGQFLEPQAMPASPFAYSNFKQFLAANKARNRKRPVCKRTAFQIFRQDECQMASLKDTWKSIRANGASKITFPKFCKQHWDNATAEFKRTFEDQVQEPQRIAAETVIFIAWQKEHDLERDIRDGLIPRLTTSTTIDS